MHKVLDYSDGCEVLEIVMPANFKTVETGKIMPVLARQEAAENIPTTDEIIARARAVIPVLAKRAPNGEHERRLPKETIARRCRLRACSQVLQPKPLGRLRDGDGDLFRGPDGARRGRHVGRLGSYGVVGVHPGLWRCSMSAPSRGSGAGQQHAHLLVR